MVKTFASLSLYAILVRTFTEEKKITIVITEFTTPMVMMQLKRLKKLNNYTPAMNMNATKSFVSNKNSRSHGMAVFICNYCLFWYKILFNRMMKSTFLTPGVTSSRSILYT